MHTPLQLIARFEVAYEGRNLIWMFEAWYIGALVDRGPLHYLTIAIMLWFCWIL